MTPEEEEKKFVDLFHKRHGRGPKGQEFYKWYIKMNLEFEKQTKIGLIEWLSKKVEEESA